MKIDLTTEEQNDNIYNVRYVWILLYKDQIHNQTGPDYEVAFVCDMEYKMDRFISQFDPDYVSQHMRIVKFQLY